MLVEQVKETYNLLEQIEADTGQKARHIGNGKYMLECCPICSHKHHFIIYTKTNSYSSFAKCCRGGSVIDWFIEFHKLSRADAVKKLCGNPQGINYREMRIRREEKAARLEREKQYVNGVSDNLCQLYKAFESLLIEAKKINLDRQSLDFQWIRFNFDFFDRYCTKMAILDFSDQKRIADNIVAFYNMEFKEFKIYYFSLQDLMHERCESIE